jgi:cell division protein FtsB
MGALANSSDHKAVWPRRHIDPGFPSTRSAETPGNFALTRINASSRMVSRRKLKGFLNALALYTCCALVIGYFCINAYTGNHGLRAKQDLDQQFTELNRELTELKLERAEWQHRVKLLKSESIDPDMLDERARMVLNYLDPRDLTLMRKP